MYIVTVIPIVKGIIRESLTYFTKKNIPNGSVVSIPLRKKVAYGLVINSQSVEDTKQNIKSLPYSIRKIENIKAHRIICNDFIESTKTIADYYASNIGSILSLLIPQVILENSDKLVYTEHLDKKESYYETALIQSDNEERYATYKSLIREEFAKGKSVYFCLPTTEDLKSAEHTLEKGIEMYTYTLHSLLPKKDIVTEWQKIIDEKHPVLIIGTGSFLSVPRDDIGTIIIEKESSRAYKSQQRPYADIRMVAQIIAKKCNKKIVFGDTLLRVETIWQQKNENFTELAPLKYRSLTTAHCEILDTRTPKDQDKKVFEIISEQLKKLLARAVENNEKTFLFCGRKGLYPVTVCSDCGTVVLCKNCSAPVVLYGTKGSLAKIVNGQENKEEQKRNLFVCHHCGERRDAQELCVHCGGWRLTPLGIGTEQVWEQVQAMFPNTHVCLMDKEHIKTHKQAVKVRDSFYETPGSIMVGTEMALTYLNETIDNTVVVSIDSFFSIPDFRINEKIFHIILEMRALSEKNMLIQTRQDKSSAHWKMFEYAIRGNLIDFYKEEITERKTFSYPPFTTYIKLSVEGGKEAVKKQMKEIEYTLAPHELLTFDAFNPGSTDRFTMHGLISMERGKWVDPPLLTKLLSLPPSVSIKVDPESLL